jgi:hypothetical protein
MDSLTWSAREFHAGTTMFPPERELMSVALESSRARDPAGASIQWLSKAIMLAAEALIRRLSRRSLRWRVSKPWPTDASERTQDGSNGPATWRSQF